MSVNADIDIDFANRDDILNIIKHIPARQENNEVSKKHNSGVYVTDIPVDPIHNCASIDYQEAEQRGYFKIDFLNMHVYSLVKDNVHYEEMLRIEPPWERLHEKGFCEKVVHISNYHNLIVEREVNSIPRMAMFLALIRPGKKHLVHEPWDVVAKEVWTPLTNGEYFFKKAHSLSYAKLVALHMNLLNHLPDGQE